MPRNIFTQGISVRATTGRVIAKKRHLSTQLFFQINGLLPHPVHSGEEIPLRVGLQGKYVSLLTPRDNNENPGVLDFKANTSLLLFFIAASVLFTLIIPRGYSCLTTRISTKAASLQSSAADSGMCKPSAPRWIG